MSNSGPPALIALTAAAVLSGCAAIPRGPGAQEVQDAVRQRSGLTVYWDQLTPPTPSAEDVVKGLLQKEMTVEDAVNVALFNNRRLQATFEDLEMTRAELVLTALPRNPILTTEVRFPASPTKPLELALTQSFWDLLQQGVRRRLAAAAFEPAKLRTADDMLNFVAEVRSAYYGLQAAEQVNGLRQTVVDAARTSAELAIRQHEAGNISDLDLENEQVMLEDAKLELMQSESEALERRERLNALLGLWGTQTSWRIAPSFPDLPAAEPSLEHVETQAVSQRLDVMAARSEIEAAARAFPLARTAGIADLELGVHRESEPEGTTTTGPALDVPIPIFPRGRAALDRAQAALRQSQQRYASVAVEARAEAREVRNRLLVARNKVEYYRDVLLPRRGRIVEFSQRNYNYMLLGVFQLLMAKESEVKARLDYIEAVRDYWVATSDLERAVGGRVRPDPGGSTLDRPAEPPREHAALETTEGPVRGGPDQ